MGDLKTVELFHGTSSNFLPDVFEHGLLPGKARDDKWNVGWSARPDLIYLTDYGAAYYAIMSAAQMSAELAARHQPAILKVLVEDTTCLFPDEDFILDCFFVLCA